MTLAQDESTSIVYGMAQQAVRLGAVDQVLPLNEIGRAIGRSMQLTGSA